MSEAAEAARDLEALRAWFNELPFSRLLGLRCVAVDVGMARITLEQPVERANPNGSVNGGAVAALADQAGGIAVSTASAPGEYFVTAQLDVHFLHPLVITPATATGRVRRRGRHLAFASVDIADADGRLCASGVGTWSLGVPPPEADWT